jgi:hypothetical protein
MNELTPGIGHNMPPVTTPPAEIARKVYDYADKGAAWIEVASIEDAEQASLLADFLSGAKALKKEVDAARVAAKKPFDEAAKAVQESFARLIAPLDLLVSKTSPKLADFATRERRAAEERRMAEQRAAAEAAAEAARLASEAQARNDVVGQAEAEAAAKEAEKAAKAAARPVKTNVQSATGGGRTMALRTMRFAVIDNASLAFMQFRDHPEVVAVLERLATAEIRSKEGRKQIPGFIVKEKESIA